MQQNRLLMEQLQAMQLQVQNSQAHFEALTSKGNLESKLFQGPQKALVGVDPALQQVFTAFRKEALHLFEAWETQKKVQAKYAKLSEEGKLHPHLQAEADHKWQWTKLFAAHAQPLMPDGRDMQDGSYDIAEAWSALRLKHARECFSFVCEHQQQCVKFYENEISMQSLQQKLLDRLDAWLAEHEYDDVAMKQALKQRAQQFVESLIRTERPKIRSRMSKEKEVQEKRQQALLEARSRWEEMDVKDVLSPALFELKHLGAKQKGSTKIRDDSALAFLVKDNAELCQKHNLKMVPASASRPERELTPKRVPRKKSPCGKGAGRDDSASKSATPRSILNSSRSPSRSPS